MILNDAREDVVLRDGSTLRLRPTSAHDQDALIGFFERLSPEARHLRFQGGVRIDARLVAPFLGGDGSESLSLVGELIDELGVTQIVGIGSYLRLRDRTRAEVAFAVADESQRHGIGTRLLERLAVHARGEGVVRFVAQVLPENLAMLSVFGDTGFEVTRRAIEGVVEVEFELTSSRGVLDRIAARDHSAVAASLARFFEPSSVAVIGASARRGSIGGELFRNVLAGDYTGAAFPVNPKGAPVGGVRGFRSVEEIGAPVELAVICVPGDQVLAAARSALQVGTRALCVISAGFAETGPDGRLRQEELLALVRQVRSPADRPELSGHRGRRDAAQCDLRATCLPARAARVLLPEWGARPRIAGTGRCTQPRPLGIRLDRQQGRRLVERPPRVLGGRRRDRRGSPLSRILRKPTQVRARRKPRCPCETDTRDAKRHQRGWCTAASSHTAALAGSDAVVDALFRKAGVLRASTLQELLDTAVVLTKLPPPAGKRVAVVTNAGGLGILCADACEEQL